MATLLGNDISSVNINAIGYNPLDNYLYGMSGSGGTGFYRIGADLSVQSLGYPVGMPVLDSIIGDFDNNGHYWMASGGTAYEVDLAPGSPTYFQLISARA